MSRTPPRTSIFANRSPRCGWCNVYRSTWPDRVAYGAMWSSREVADRIAVSAIYRIRIKMKEGCQCLTSS